MSAAFVLFRLSERTFASRLDDVREIARLGTLQKLPGTSAPELYAPDELVAVLMT